MKTRKKQSKIKMKSGTARRTGRVTLTDNPGTAGQSVAGASIRSKGRNVSRPQLLNEGVNIPRSQVPPQMLLSLAEDRTSAAIQLVDIERESNTQLEDLERLVFLSVTCEPFTHDEIQKMSVVNVSMVLGNNEDNTVNDQRMGSSGQNHCHTCKLRDSCPGHNGHIAFAKPIFNPIYMKDSTITQILNSVCSGCIQTYMTPEQVESKFGNIPPTKRLSKLAAETYKECPRTSGLSNLTGDLKIKDCGKPRHYIHSKSKEYGQAYYKGEGGVEGLTEAEKVYDMFKLIKDSDAKLMGFKSSAVFSRLIMHSMLVPPLQVRPPRISGGIPHMNELTSKLNAIVSANAELRTAMANENSVVGGETSVTEATTKLYKAVAEYQRYITEEVQGKDGKVRGELMRKRGDFCARAVLGPATDVALDEIAIPEHWKYDLTPIVEVTESNIGEIAKLLAQGHITYITSGPRSKYPGIRRLVRPNHSKIAVGDKVERWLQDGDLVAFNRQPTLHKQNLMGFKVVLQERNTVGIHLSVTTPTHSDFDGDDGDVWPHLSENARDEMAGRMNVCRNIMSSKSNQPIIHLVYDSITAAYLLTAPIHNGEVIRIDIDTYFDAISTFTCTDQLTTLNERLHRHGLWNLQQEVEGEVRKSIGELNPTVSGRALFSALLPENFELHTDKVHITGGVLISGSITSANVGGAHRSIVQLLHKLYGWKRASQFITDATWALRIFLDATGYSIGVDDCDYLNREVEVENPKASGGVESVKVRDVVRKEIIKAEVLKATLGPPTGDPLRDRENELKVNDIVDGVRSVGIKILGKVQQPGDSIRVASKDGGGAKGSSYNTLQISMLLGQMYYGNERIARGLSGGERALSYFKPGDYSLASQGFISHGFMEGLTPSETFFHFMGSREGLADTAVKASSVGQLQRSITKSMESVIVFPDTSVRTHDGKIVQFSYGEDGFDASELIKLSTPSMPERAFFTDPKLLADRINSEYGWNLVPRTEK